MPSMGAMKEKAMMESSAPKKPPQFMRHMMMEKAASGGVVAHHVMNNFEGKDPVHVFAAGDGAKLAAHIEEHMGIKMPGRATGTVASPSEGAAAKDESE